MPSCIYSFADSQEQLASKTFEVRFTSSETGNNSQICSIFYILSIIADLFDKWLKVSFPLQGTPVFSCRQQPCVTRAREPRP